MMRVTFVLPDDLGKEFRVRVIERYGNEKGALSRAIAEAIRLWIREKEAPVKKR
jgi:metal-responsive CopG/Arc/MetJ family transcriptional regulator